MALTEASDSFIWAELHQTTDPKHYLDCRQIFFIFYYFCYVFLIYEPHGTSTTCLLVLYFCLFPSSANVENCFFRVAKSFSSVGSNFIQIVLGRHALCRREEDGGQKPFDIFTNF